MDRKGSTGADPGRGNGTGNGTVQWGVEAQTGILTDVLLGKPDHFEWVNAAVGLQAAGLRWPQSTRPSVQGCVARTGSRRGSLGRASP